MLGRNNANRRGSDWPPEASPVDSLFLVCVPFVLEADRRGVGPTLAGLETRASPLASHLIGRGKGTLEGQKPRKMANGLPEEMCSVDIDFHLPYSVLRRVGNASYRARCIRDFQC